METVPNLSTQSIFLHDNGSVFLFAQRTRVWLQCVVIKSVKTSARESTQINVYGCIQKIPIHFEKN